MLCIGNLNNLFLPGAISLNSASAVNRLKILSIGKFPVLLRMARATQRSEARDWLAVAALAQTQSERQRSASVSNRFGLSGRLE